MYRVYAGSGLRELNMLYTVLNMMFSAQINLGVCINMFIIHVNMSASKEILTYESYPN